MDERRYCGGTENMRKSGESRYNLNQINRFEKLKRVVTEDRRVTGSIVVSCRLAIGL